MRHLTLEQIEDFVQGRELEDTAWFREHVLNCERCARRLADEARLEETLLVAARPRLHLATEASRRSSRRWISLAAAAASLLVVAWLSWLALPRMGSEPLAEGPGNPGRKGERADTLGISLPPIGFDEIPMAAASLNTMPEYALSSFVEPGLEAGLTSELARAH